MDYADYTQLGRIRRGVDVGAVDGVGHWGLSAVSSGASTQEFSPTTSMREHLRLVTSSDDGIVLEKLTVARRRIEARTYRRCFQAQYDYAIDRFPWDGSPIRLPLMPVVSIDSITYYDSAGVAHTFSSSGGYFLDTYSEPQRVCLNTAVMWPLATRPRVGGVIRFTAGYSTTPGSGIPDPLVEAIRKLATDLYENREGSGLGVNENQVLPYGIEEMIAEFLPVEVG